MKSVISLGVSALALSLAFASQAHATSILINQQDDGIQITSVQFHVNTSLGRAWADVDTYDSSASMDDGESSNEVSCHVDGLSYDAATSAIVYAGATGTVVCAHVVSGRHGLLIQPTGACGFHHARGARTVDDGFNTHVERTVDVFFDVK